MPLLFFYRYLSQKEIDEKIEYNIKAGEPDKPVPPVQSQPLTKKPLEALVKHKAALSYHSFELFTGLPGSLIMDDLPMNMMQLHRDIYVSMEGKNCIHLRTYYKDKGSSEFYPKGPGMLSFHLTPN